MIGWWRETRKKEDKRTVGRKREDGKREEGGPAGSHTLNSA